MKPRSMLKISKISRLLVAVTAIFVIASFIAPAISVSTSPCSLYHGTQYYQQLDLQEGSVQIPTNLQVGQVATVSVTLQNLNNAPKNNLLTSVSVSLQSQNNHFSVNNPNFNVGSLPTGSKTASWQITGISAGTDQLVISASATNTHESLTFADTYSPNPTITISGASVTPSPTPIPPTPTSTQTQNPTPTTPTSTPNIIPTPTNPPIDNPTPTITPAPQQTNSPTSSNSPTIAPNPTNQSPTSTATINPTPQNPTPTATPIQSDRDIALNSGMIYIHPPLAIAGYVFIFIFTLLVLRMEAVSGKSRSIIGLIAWVLTALGLLTGMIWAQIVTGSYWSWDPKETFTLGLFLAFSVGQVAYFEKKQKVTKAMAILSCFLVILTASSSLIISSL